jgi:hypothetical protein
MNFTPLKFQGTLAAAGVALMPFIFLKAQHLSSDGELFATTLLPLANGPMEYVGILFSIGVAGLFILLHFGLSVLFLKELFTWITKTKGLSELLANPLTNTTLFSPLISLPMSMLVFLGPASLFIPQISANRQALMIPAFIYFSLLWLCLLGLKLKTSSTFRSSTIDYAKLNYGWLLDVLAFGAVSLLGANIVVTTENSLLAACAAYMVMVSILVGITVFSLKLIILVHQQIKSKTMPAISLLPAYFLVIPPICLLGFSFYKILGYTGKVYVFDARTVAIMLLVVSYITAISWFAFSFYILREYLQKRFLSSDFSPAQWGIV